MHPLDLPAREVRSRRTIICQGIDELIYDNSKPDIEDAIERFLQIPTWKQEYIPDEIEFEDASMATKAEENGLRLFNMIIAGHHYKEGKVHPTKNMHEVLQNRGAPNSSMPTTT
ncbi:hypothetical protein Pcinc_008330 [Petrolisthes cinctipes]|uniref:Uncharacterized protein n=1 Tax=Petrolisthes cinctipes TaxID=88211 RepID=A0AAE1G9K2_PETCI|nr:hypothetical protein Pcinc_008330 [Petrolisthes cinctipes]